MPAAAVAAPGCGPRTPALVAALEAGTWTRRAADESQSRRARTFPAASNRPGVTRRAPSAICSCWRWTLRAGLPARHQERQLRQHRRRCRAACRRRCFEAYLNAARARSAAWPSAIATRRPSIPPTAAPGYVSQHPWDHVGRRTLRHARREWSSSTCSRPIAEVRIRGGPGVGIRTRATKTIDISINRPRRVALVEYETGPAGGRRRAAAGRAECAPRPILIKAGAASRCRRVSCAASRGTVRGSHSPARIGRSPAAGSGGPGHQPRCRTVRDLVIKGPYNVHRHLRNADAPRRSSPAGRTTVRGGAAVAARVRSSPGSASDAYRRGVDRGRARSPDAALRERRRRRPGWVRWGLVRQVGRVGRVSRVRPVDSKRVCVGAPRGDPGESSLHLPPRKRSRTPRAPGGTFRRRPTWTLAVAPLRSSCGARPPDQELLDGSPARAGSRPPATLEKQTAPGPWPRRRARADAAGHALRRAVAAAAGRGQGPSPIRTNYPNFDDNLGPAAMRRETELFFDSLVRDDRSALDLFRADYTFRQRSARPGHYGFPRRPRASQFRRVTYPRRYAARGLLGQGSVLVQGVARQTAPSPGAGAASWVDGSADGLGAAGPAAGPDRGRRSRETARRRRTARC